MLPALRPATASFVLLLSSGCEIARAPGSQGAPPATVETGAGSAQTVAGTAAPVPTEHAAADSAARVAPSASAVTASVAPSAATEATTRLYAKARFAWIAPAPGAGGAWVGYVTAGGSVPARGPAIAGAGGCDAWYPVEPRGYVCRGTLATTDARDPTVMALAVDAPRVDSPWPYDYAESLGAPRYDKLPSVDRQRRSEEGFEAYMERVRRAREAPDPEAVAAIDKSLVGVDLKPTGVTAPALFDPGGLVREWRDRIFPGSTVAFTRAFDDGDRSWVLTADHALVPRDRVRPYPRSQFAGVMLTGDVKLPIAFFRKKERPKYRRDASGAFTPTGETWAPKSWVGLTGDEATEASGPMSGKRFLATKEAGLWALADDATPIRGATRAPFSPDEARDPSRRNSWVEISVLGGWLVAYERLEPVFATLVSPGRGGLPVPGKDPISTASTPLGTYRVDGKFRTATMVSSTDSNLVHTEVQYVQNFHGAHALHGAYWHDSFGEPKSGGCVNLSPIDSKWLFDWTDPRVPEGWHGLRATREFGPPTVVVVHR